jgi:hypothetical protein
MMARMAERSEMVKTVLNSNESRTYNRRATPTRRIADRRASPHPFGSDEWLAQIEANYAYWPKIERRQKDRRTADRRVTDRRQQASTGEKPTVKPMPQPMLTAEERKLIEDLFLYDLRGHTNNE